MGGGGSSQYKANAHSRRESLVKAQPKGVSGVKIHALITESFDLNNDGSEVPLRLATDQELIAEVARRKLDIVASMTDSLVNETYTFSEPLGSGASGQVFMATHKITHKKYACKKIQKDNHINDLESMITEIEILKRIRHRYIVSVNEIYEVRGSFTTFYFIFSSFR
jgi:serine/threonine protein kinase